MTIGMQPAVPTDIRNRRFAGAFGSAHRVTMTEDAKFALGL
jgi:hypothetical protein